MHHHANHRLLRALVLALGLFLLPPRAFGAPTASCQVLESLPHGRDAYTQGLFFNDGRLIETTGRYGVSAIRILDPRNGLVLRQVSLPKEVFGEGATLLNGRIYILTWRSGRVFVLDAKHLVPLGELTLSGEGWGLTTDGRRLLSSDGSDRLTWRDPMSLAPLGEIRVTDDGRPVTRLNELEWVDGLVLANVWLTSRIAAIDPDSGHVLSWLDCEALTAGQGQGPDDVLNGIAYDPAGKRLYVTGKRWPTLYRVAPPDHATVKDQETP